jgi:hypothetical protein
VLESKLHLQASEVTFRTYIGVPVQFSQAVWLEGDKCGGDCLANRKVGRVDLVEGSTTARDVLGRMLKCMVDERTISSQGTSRASRDLFGAHGAVKDSRIRLLAVSAANWQLENGGRALTLGMLSKTDSGTPKFLATTSLGVWAIQSSTLNVVLFHVSELRHIK